MSKDRQSEGREVLRDTQTVNCAKEIITLIMKLLRRQRENPGGRQKRWADRERERERERGREREGGRDGQAERGGGREADKGEKIHPK